MTLKASAALLPSDSTVADDGLAHSHVRRAAMRSVVAPDQVADLQLRLDAQQGLWSSRRVRATLLQTLIHGGPAHA